MIRASVILCRRHGLSWAEFSRSWRDVHGPLVLQRPGLRGYRQQHVKDAFFGGTTPCDGIAEVWFDTPDAPRAASASPAGQAVLADNPNFADDERTKLVVPDEVVVMGVRDE